MLAKAGIILDENDRPELVYQWEDYLLQIAMKEQDSDAVIRLAELYVLCIKDYLANKVGRKYYKYACKYIRRIKKLEQIEIADKLIEELREVYWQITALLEELKLI